MLDAGYAELLSENPRPTHIFITHGHADHSFMLPYLVFDFVVSCCFLLFFVVVVVVVSL